MARSTGVAPPVEIMAALADPTRWQVLTELGRGDASASALAERLPVSRQAIAKHLAVLEAAALVERVPAGREVRFRVVGATLNQVARRLDAIGTAWDARLARLVEHVESDPAS